MNGKSTNTSIIFADGLGFHYTENEKVRKSLAEIFPAVIPLHSILGYSAGIHPSIWTSSYPRDHGWWTIWALKKDFKPRPLKISRSAWLLGCLSRYGVKRVQQFLGVDSQMNAAAPRSISKFFDYMDLNIKEPFMLENPPSFFSIMSRNNIKYRYSLCRRIEEMSLQEGGYDVQVFLLGEFDSLGHSRGPNSSFIIARMLDFLRVVKAIAKKSEFVFLFPITGCTQ